MGKLRVYAWLLLLASLAYAAPPSVQDLCRQLPDHEQKVGTGAIRLKLEVEPADSVLNSVVRARVTGATLPAELWMAREDYWSPTYSFPDSTDDAHRRLEVGPSGLVDLGSLKRGNVYYFRVAAAGHRHSPLVIRTMLIPCRREAEVSGLQARLERSRQLREALFADFGFRPQAASHIRSTSAFEVKHLDGPRGGGGWMPWDRLVAVEGTQREAAVHENAHVWWHDYRRQHPEAPRELARAVVRLADMDPEKNPDCREAILFARGYVNGIGTWQGMYSDGKKRVRDVHHLTEEDFRSRVNDWEIFAGFSSYTMGQYRSGPHRLPGFMGPFFEPLFLGRIRRPPYYQGGEP